MNCESIILILVLFTFFLFFRNYEYFYTSTNRRNGNTFFAIKKHEMKLNIGKQVRWRCAKSTCRSEIQLRVGTWLEGSRIPYVTIVRFIYAWAYEYTSGDFCERELQLDPHTTVDWNNYLRCICIDHLLNNPYKMIGI